MERNSLDNQPDPNSGKRVSLLILGAAAFMVAADARCVDPLLRTVAVDFNVLLKTAALVVSAYALPYGLGQLVYGPLGDRIGKVHVMAVAFSLFALGTGACAFVPGQQHGLHLLIGLRFFTGVFAAAIIPLSIAYIGDKFSPEKRQAVLGEFMSALMLGAVFSGPMGGIFGEYLGWRNLFLLLGGLSVCVALAFMKSARSEPRPVKDPSKPTTPVIKGYANVLANPDAWVVYPAIFFEGLFLFGGFVYISSSLQDQFKLDILIAGVLVGFYGIGGLIYSFSAKRILRQLKQWQMAAMGGLLLMMGFGIAAALPTMKVWWPIIPALLMIGFGFNSVHSTLQTKATELAPKARGTAVSIFAFFFFLGQALGVQGGINLGSALSTREFAFFKTPAPESHLFLNLMSGAKNLDVKTIPAYWAIFATAGAGLFLMSLALASRLPKMKKELAVTAPRPNLPASADLQAAQK
jgi:YNFM family putative membrane transporter